MKICSDCQLEKWTEAAGDPDDPGFCECPILKIEPYLYDEEDDPEEVT